MIACGAGAGADVDAVPFASEGFESGPAAADAAEMEGDRGSCCCCSPFVDWLCADGGCCCWRAFVVVAVAVDNEGAAKGI
jgi:hypothetical protein